MRHVDYFDSFLSNTVNLSQFRLETLERQANAVYNALKADAELGPRITGMIPQGSWAQETIINPVNSKEVDADFLLQMKEEPDWAIDPQQYSNAVWKALHDHRSYSSMPHGRKCRCVFVKYANSTHVDVVPYVILSVGRKVIVNRDDNSFENTDPEGFTAWMKEKDRIANRNLRKVIRLMKFLRDHKGSFDGVRSILLTTLLGQQVKAHKKVFEPGYYSDVPTTLLHVVADLNTYLQSRVLKPSIPDPSGSGVTFDHRWTPETYSNFRTRLNVIATDINDAFHETDPDASIEKWQGLFGDKFQPPKKPSSGGKFGDDVAAAAGSSTGRVGRAG
jgi:Second Messenger Oligonucleotide or Dinucleotide Synthetase domain